MTTTKQIEEELNELYSKLNEFRKTINEAIDKIGAVSDSVPMYGIEEEDSTILSDAVKNIVNAANSICFEVDDSGPHLAGLLKDQCESLKGICDFCGEPFEYIEGDTVITVNHKSCREQ